MSSLTVLAVLSGVLMSQAASETRWAVDADHAPRVGIFLDFDHDPSLSSVAAMEREVGDVLKATGFQFS